MVVWDVLWKTQGFIWISQGKKKNLTQGLLQVIWKTISGNISSEAENGHKQEESQRKPLL